MENEVEAGMETEMDAKRGGRDGGEWWGWGWGAGELRVGRRDSLEYT